MSDIAPTEEGLSSAGAATDIVDLAIQKAYAKQAQHKSEIAAKEARIREITPLAKEQVDEFFRLTEQSVNLSKVAARKVLSISDPKVDVTQDMLDKMTKQQKEAVREEMGEIMGNSNEAMVRRQVVERLLGKVTTEVTTVQPAGRGEAKAGA